MVEQSTTASTVAAAAAAGHAAGATTQHPAVGPLPPGIEPPDGPLDGVTEIRIHGVGGATPQSMLGDPDPRLVSGDRVAGFYRTADTQGRHVEAYSWGGLTSRSRTRALWILLLPFLLTNLAGWMAPARAASGADDERRPPTSRWYRWAARVSSLSVTLAVLMVLCLLGLDVIAYQCGGQPGCVDRWWLAPLGAADIGPFPARRLLVGAILPLGVLAVFAVLSYASRSRYERVDPPVAAGMPTGAATSGTSAAALPDGLADPEFWQGQRAHAWLSRLHLAVGLALVALVIGCCTARIGDAAGVAAAIPWVGWLAAILGAAVVLTAVIVLARDTPVRGLGVAMLVGAGASLLAAAVFAWAQPASAPVAGPLPGIVLAFNATWVVVAGGLVALAAVLGGMRRQARTAAARRALARESGTTFGWAGPFVVLAFGFILSHTILLSVVVFVAGLFGGVSYYWPSEATRDGVAGTFWLPEMVRVATTVLVLGALLVVAGFAVCQLLRYARRRGESLRAFAGKAESDYPGQSASRPAAVGSPDAWLMSALTDDPGGPRRRSARRRPDPSNRPPTRWVRRAVRWRFLARATPTVSALLTWMIGIALGVVIPVEILFALGRLPEFLTLPAFLTDLAIRIAVAIPPAMLALVVISWRQLGRRRIVGTLWDVGTFWPRAFHPFAPPCYTERAVPELTRRIWWLHDNHGRVTLAAHSQGSVVAAAAILQRSPRPPEKRIALVTFGAPLRKLYHWAFPAYVPLAALDDIAAGSTPSVAATWRNVYYPTDYIGGPVGAGHPPEHAAAAERLLVSVDERLPDPPSSMYVYGQDAPAVLSHTGYWGDARFHRVVDLAAARLADDANATPAPPPTPASANAAPDATDTPTAAAPHRVSAAT